MCSTIKDEFEAKGWILICIEILLLLYLIEITIRNVDLLIHEIKRKCAKKDFVIS